MKDRERALFDEARAWDPVEPAMLARVARRLKTERRRPRLFVPLSVLAAVAAGALFFLRPAPPAEVQPDPGMIEAHRPPPRFERTETPPVEPPSEAIARRTEPRPTPAPEPTPRNKQSAPALRAMAEPRAEPPERLVEKETEQKTRSEAAPRAEPDRSSSKSARKPYVPRAIVEFTRVDWKRLERHDELPAYVQSIVARRDPNALLAALDQLDVAPELRLIRGELRAGAARCAEAVRDFDAILDDTAAGALHVRAAQARSRCLP